MICTVTFNPSLDCFFDGEISANTLNKLSQRITFGGKGINVSACLNSLGIENIALGFCAGASGAWLEELLDNANICHDFVKLSSGFTRINAKAGKTEINALGPVVDNAAFLALEKKLARAEFDTIVISGSAPNGIDNAYERICKNLKNKRLVIDTTGVSLASALKFKPYLVKPNLEELCEFFSAKIKTDNEIVFYAERLIKMGAQNVLVSCGKGGLILVSQTGEKLKAGTIKGKVFSTVACGDSTLAGFLAQGTLNERFLLASACGNACALSGKIPDKSAILSAKNALSIIEIH